MYCLPHSSWNFSRSRLQMLLLGFMLTILAIQFSIIAVQEMKCNTAICLHKACIAYRMRVKISIANVIPSSFDAMDTTIIWLASSTVKVCQNANGHPSRVVCGNGLLSMPY